MAILYHLGIDLHKRFSYWTLINNNRDVIFQGKVPTTEGDMAKALQNIPVEKRDIQAVIEPVTEWGWYAEALEKQGLTVKLADPGKSKLIAASRLKNDKVDSTILAELLRSDFLPTAYLAPRETRELREFVRGRIFLVRLRTKIKNRIHSIVAKQGLHSSRSDLFGKKGLAWLQGQTLSPVFQEQVVSLLSIIDLLNEEIKKKDMAIIERAKRDAEAKLLMSMPGIGAFTATMIQAEVGTFARFASADKLASYAGLVSSSRSSGEKQRFGSITRAGSAYLRSIMVEAACHLRPSWGYLFSFYTRIKEKKGNKIARVALARKMLTILWHMQNKKEPFRALPLGDSPGVKR